MRILLLSLYYPPLNTIAALRIKAFEKYLTEFGFTVDVITRYYDSEQQKGQSMFLGNQSAKDFKEDYFKINNVIYTNFDENNEKLDFSNKLPAIVKGLYNYLNIDVFHYGWIKYALNAFDNELSHNKYDFVIASYGPPVSMLLANKLFKKYKIPFLIDFRDSYINEKDVSFHLTMKQKVLNAMLKRSSGLIFSTEGMKDYFLLKTSQNLQRIPSCIVYNGVEELSQNGDIEEKKITEFWKIHSKHDLILLHAGTLYPGQNVSFFINSTSKFNTENNKNVGIIFLGLSENRMNEIEPLPFIHFLPKSNYSTSLFLQKEADALILPIWNGRYTGFSGKTQEYLYSGNFIITSPNPQNDLKLFLDISPNVRISNDYDSFSKFLDDIISGNCTKLQLNNKEKLYRFFWVKRLAEFLRKLKTNE